MKPTLALMAVLAALVLISAGLTRAGEPQPRPATTAVSSQDIPWSRTVNGLKARISLKRFAVSNGTPIIRLSLSVHNEYSPPMAIAWKVDRMQFQIVDSQGREVTEGIDGGGKYSERGIPPWTIVLPSGGELSFPVVFASGAGITGDQAGMLIVASPSYVWTFQRNERDLYLRAVIEIPEPSVQRTDDLSDWFGRIELPDVKIPLKPDPVDSEKVSASIERLARQLSTGTATSNVEEALRELSLIDDDRVIPLYVKLMDTRDYELKFSALDRLSRFKGDLALSGLRKGMQTQAADMDHATTQEVANNMAEQIRHAAALALMRSPHPDARKLLLSMANDPYYGVRLDVVHALGGEDSVSARQQLEGMTHDPNQMVRDEAARLLKARTASPAPTSVPRS